MPTIAQKVQGGFYRAFYAWGGFVARKPCLVIVCSFVLSLLLGSHIFWGTVENEVEQEKLWVPAEAESQDAKRDYEALYGRQSRRNSFLFTTVPRGDNVLTRPVLEEVARFASVLTEQMYAWEGVKSRDLESLGLGNVSYASLCARAGLVGANHSATSSAGCVSFNHPLELWRRANGSYDFAYTNAQILATVNAGRGADPVLFPLASDRTVNVDAIFGGIERDASGTITKAKAIQLVLSLADYSQGTDNRTGALAWEDQANILVGDEWTQADWSKGSVSVNYVPHFTSSSVAVYPNTAGAISREFSGNIRGDLVAVQIAYMIIFVYATFVFGRTTVVDSRSLLAASGVAAVGLAILVAYGLTTIFLPLNPVVNVLPFILIGIGVDDMFVLIAALESTPKGMPVVERMSHAMGTAGVSITITSITDLFAFILGVTSKLPALSGFCTFAAIGIFFDYLMQITFFAGWMALDVYRENKKKVDCCPCCLTAEVGTTGCCCCPCTFGCCGPAPTEPYGLRPFMKKYYIPMLRSPIVKGVVLVGFTAFFGVSAYGAAQLKQDFEYEWFVNDDAQIQETWRLQNEYFTATGGVPVYLITPSSSSVSYTSAAGQGTMLTLAADVQANSYIEAGSVYGWYSEFRGWVNETYALDTAGFVPSASFFTYLEQFLAAPTGRRFERDLLWVSDVPTDGVSATRFHGRYRDLPDAQTQVSSMRSLRSTVSNVNFGSTFPYTFAYLFYEQYAIIVREAVTNLALAFAAVIIITLFIVADVGATALVGLMIAMVDVDLLGLMHFWGLTIDSVSVINLVLAIGLALDYSVHMAHAFLQTPGTRQERVDAALDEMGVPVVHGAFSTFLAVVILSVSKSYVFRIFFKMFFGIVVFGAAHGLVLLPVLLSLIGPAYIDTGRKSMEEMAKEKAGGEMEMGPVTSTAAGETVPATPPTV